MNGRDLETTNQGSGKVAELPPAKARSLVLLGAGIIFMAALMLASTATATPAAASPARQDPTQSAVERLAEPTLPPDPAPADYGAQDYWLRCLACHGDRGQGLTDEFRQLYPPDHQTCWTSGCHGDNPYEGGFTLPTQVPAVIDPTIPEQYNSSTLDQFVRQTMPWHAPGSLSDAEYDRIVTFLLVENGMKTLRDFQGSPEPAPNQEPQRPTDHLPPSSGTVAAVVLGLLAALLLGTFVVFRVLPD